MDGDQYVPIATIASLERIQAITTDLDLIVELLKGKKYNIVKFESTIYIKKIVKHFVNYIEPVW